MSNSSKDENIFIVISIIIVGLLALGIWKFSSAINVDFETGFYVLFGEVVIITFCCVLLKLGILSIGQVIPLLIGGGAFALFPALDYWSIQVVGEMQSSFSLGEPMWYARWYSKTAFVLVPIFGGYGLRHIFSR